MVFISAGHNSQSKTIPPDPGAIGVHGIKEGDLTIEFRDLVKIQLTKLAVPFICDSDEESLLMYLTRIKPQTGPASIIIEYHFDSGVPAATGTTGIVEDNADRLDIAFSKDITDSTASTLQIKNRGVITESLSKRGRLGLMREHGLVTIAELAFVTNQGDIDNYNKFKIDLAVKHAIIIKQYHALTHATVTPSLELHS